MTQAQDIQSPEPYPGFLAGITQRMLLDEAKKREAIIAEFFSLCPHVNPSGCTIREVRELDGTLISWSLTNLEKTFFTVTPAQAHTDSSDVPAAPATIQTVSETPRQ